MDGTGDDQHFFITHFSTLTDFFFTSHLLKGSLAEVAAVGILTVNEQHGVLYLAGPAEQRLVEERLLAGERPEGAAVSERGC